MEDEVVGCCRVGGVVDVSKPVVLPQKQRVERNEARLNINAEESIIIDTGLDLFILDSRRAFHPAPTFNGAEGQNTSQIKIFFCTILKKGNKGMICN